MKILVRRLYLFYKNADPFRIGVVLDGVFLISFQLLIERILYKQNVKDADHSPQSLDLHD